MPARPVLRMGHPLLLQKAKPIREFDTTALHELVRDMRDTMKEREGVGLAAPQIGESIQLVIFGMEYSPRYPDAEPISETILLNPIIEPLSDDTDYDWEGCLSVPGMRGLVKRNTEIRYTGYDLYGKTIVREVSGFHARVVQHECDHLWGVLYPMRINDLRDWGFREEMVEYHNTRTPTRNKS